MDRPNKELLQAFIDWFMREYSNFGGKPISERYDEAFDTFNNDFIDARYDAFQDGWKAQQAKVEELEHDKEFAENSAQEWTAKAIEERNAKLELQKRVDAALKETRFALQYVEDDMRGNHEFLKMAMIRTFKVLEQALNGGEA
nr:hypothetical protein [Acinetobacter baumannii]